MDASANAAIRHCKVARQERLHHLPDLVGRKETVRISADVFTGGIHFVPEHRAGVNQLDNEAIGPVAEVVNRQHGWRQLFGLAAVSEVLVRAFSISDSQVSMKATPSCVFLKAPSNITLSTARTDLCYQTLNIVAPMIYSINSHMAGLGARECDPLRAAGCLKAAAHAD